ncbi:MAG: signal peptidase I [Candidatus Accumulibacter sp. UW25]
MNFALILLILLLVSGAIWAADALVLRKRRPAGAKDPWWVEYGASFFPVILVVFVLRSFLVEPFKIPSGSMIPTLQVGDFILVNKYTYGIRLPVVNWKIIDINSPQRGDVMVFRYPEDPSLDYIKRVIGLPGDRVVYQNKRLTINGQPVATTRVEDYLHPERLYYSRAVRREARCGRASNAQRRRCARRTFAGPAQFPNRELCSYNAAGVSCTVPPGQYFVMGDNRDNSRDSRFWGFVPEANIVGKAFFIWLNFSDFSRIGSFR